jgi:large subunit ribosomal protein L25
VAGERIQLTVKQREHLGSAETRRLRRAGFVPGVLYGKDSPRPIVVAERDLRSALTGPSGLHAVLDVVLEGQSTAHPSILKEYQQDPIRGKLAHIDLQEVRLDQPIQAAVTITLTGESAGVKEGGVLNQVSATVNVMALPMEVPEHIDADVSALQIGDTLRLADLTAPEGATFVDDPEETVIATVAAPRVEEEPEVEEAEELAEGEEAPEGEGAPDAEASGEAAAEGGDEAPATDEG